MVIYLVVGMFVAMCNKVVGDRINKIMRPQMNSENTNLEFARIAFEGENYSEAYDKYSRVLEMDFNNVDGWQGKGLSAAYNSDLNSIKFKECILCVN